MEKEINGQRIHLDDNALALLEMSVIGSYARQRLENIITSELDIPDYTRNMVEYFCNALRALPDALITLSCTLKYVVIAREMKRRLEAAHLFVPKLIPCNYGIIVASTSQMHIVLQERTWVLAANIADDKISDLSTDRLFNIDLFKDDKWFEYFKLIDGHLANGKRMKNKEFIQVVLPELASICTSDSLLRWELSRLFIFEQFTDNYEDKIRQGWISDIQTGKFISIQIFWTGQTIPVSNKSVLVIDVRNKRGYDEQEKRRVYDWMVSVLSPAGVYSQLVKSKVLFKSIADIAIAKVEEGVPLADIKIKGLLYDNYVAVDINDTLVVGKLGANNKLRILGTGTSILNLDGPVVTFAVDKVNSISQVNIRTIAVYDIEKNTTKIVAKLFSATQH